MERAAPAPAVQPWAAAAALRKTRTYNGNCACSPRGVICDEVYDVISTQSLRRLAR